MPSTSAWICSGYSPKVGFGKLPGWSASCRRLPPLRPYARRGPCSHASSRRRAPIKRPVSGNAITAAGLRPRATISSRRSSIWYPNWRATRRRQPSSTSQPTPRSIARLADFLAERHVRTLIVSGAETDVCVLSTVLDAVNIGFRVVILQDCLCSSSDEGHDALMTMYRLRYTEQIDLITADMLPEMWVDLAA